MKTIFTSHNYTSFLLFDVITTSPFSNLIVVFPTLYGSSIIVPFSSLSSSSASLLQANLNFSISSCRASVSLFAFIIKQAPRECALLIFLHKSFNLSFLQAQLLQFYSLCSAHTFRQASSCVKSEFEYLHILSQIFSVNSSFGSLRINDIGPLLYPHCSAIALAIPGNV